MFSQGCTSKNSKLLTLFKQIAHVSNQNFNLANTCMQKALFCTRAVGNPVISKFKVYLLSTTTKYKKTQYFGWLPEWINAFLCRPEIEHLQ